jgi:hypothetical protein
MIPALVPAHTIAQYLTNQTHSQNDGALVGRLRCPAGRSGATSGKYVPAGDSPAVGCCGGAAVILLTEMELLGSNCRSAEEGVLVGTKTIMMYVSDLDQSEIPPGQAYQLSIRHPDGSIQQLDISEKNYRDLKLAGVGKTLKKRGRKPGSTTGAAGAPRRRRRRETSEPPVTTSAARPPGAGGGSDDDDVLEDQE